MDDDHDGDDGDGDGKDDDDDDRDADGSTQGQMPLSTYWSGKPASQPLRFVLCQSVTPKEHKFQHAHCFYNYSCSLFLSMARTKSLKHGHQQREKPHNQSWNPCGGKNETCAQLEGQHIPRFLGDFRLIAIVNGMTSSPRLAPKGRMLVASSKIVPESARAALGSSRQQQIPKRPARHFVDAGLPRLTLFVLKFCCHVRPLRGYFEVFNPQCGWRFAASPQNEAVKVDKTGAGNNSRHTILLHFCCSMLRT